MRSSIVALLVVVSLPVVPGDARGAILYTVTDLGTLGGKNSWADGINNSRQVVGMVYFDATTEYAWTQSPNRQPSPSWRSVPSGCSPMLGDDESDKA
jgi:hypothetical protein